MDDAEMAALVEFFVDELALRLRDLEAAHQAGDATRLCRIAHQLRGAAAGYGFPEITRVAGELEDAFRSQPPALHAIDDKLHALVDLCRRVFSAHGKGARSTGR